MENDASNFCFLASLSQCYEGEEEILLTKAERMGKVSLSFSTTALMMRVVVVDGGGGALPKVSTTLMGSQTREDWVADCSGTKMNLANPAPSPIPTPSIL